MLRIEEKHYSKIEQSIQSELFSEYFRDIVRVISSKYGEIGVKNSNDSVVRAIQNRTLAYTNREFIGVFTASISKRLSTFCTFDGRSKSFRVNDGEPVPNDIRTASILVRTENSDTANELNHIIGDIESNSITIDVSSIHETIDDISESLSGDIGVPVILSESEREQLAADYSDNINLTIDGWKTEQISRLRKLVFDIHETGFSKGSLRDIIQREWNVTSNRAQFIARQETSLFLAKFRREKSLSAGIRKYKWSTSGDEDVRPYNGTRSTRGNNHRMLQGRVFEYGKPPIVDTKTGRRAEPGEDYGCRCVAVPVIE